MLLRSICQPLALHARHQHPRLASPLRIHLEKSGLRLGSLEIHVLTSSKEIPQGCGLLCRAQARGCSVASHSLLMRLPFNVPVYKSVAPATIAAFDLEGRLQSQFSWQFNSNRLTGAPSGGRTSKQDAVLAHRSGCCERNP